MRLDRLFPPPHALGQPSEGTGTSIYGVPVPRFFWPALIVLLGVSAAGIPLGGEAMGLAAAALMLAGGLPHGAFDIAIARRALRLGPGEALRLLGAYIAVALAMLALWAAAPIVALALFLMLAAIHFGEDWRMLDAGLLRAMAGAAIICVPAFGRPDEVAALFEAMAGPDARIVARIAMACAPMVLLVTLVGIAVAVSRGHLGWAAAQSAALATLAFAPPQIGFALYFVFLHSPLHMRGLGSALPGWAPRRLILYGAGICAICLAGAALLAPGLWSGESLRVSADGFRLLAVVAAPHLMLSLVLERRTRAASGRNHDFDAMAMG